MPATMGKYCNVFTQVLLSFFDPNGIMAASFPLGTKPSSAHLNNDSINVLGDPDTRYVVYNIEYKKESQALDMTIHLAEV